MAAYRRPRVLFLVTEDWYFCSHRLALAKALAAAGCEVAVACRVADHAKPIEAAGIGLYPLALSRRSVNPFAAVAAVSRIARLYAAYAPDVVHHVALKPAILGSLAARIARRGRIINAIAGLGFVFSAKTLRARLLRPFVQALLRAVIDGPETRVIVQNAEDGEALTRSGMVDPAHLALIRGAGVDLERFRPSPEPPGPVRVSLVARMIREKGIAEMVEAARLLGPRGSDVRVSLIGAPDPENPSSIPEATLAEWAAEGVVEMPGRVEDTAALWRESHIAALPSYYGEGVPLALIEAAASGRPMIAARGPGLTDIVRDGETGIVVPPRDSAALADAIERLAGDAELRRRMGAAARAHAEAAFGADAVIAATIALYRDLLGSDWPGA